MSRVEASAIGWVTPTANRPTSTPSEASVAPRPPGRKDSAPMRVVVAHKKVHRAKLASTPANPCRISQ